MNTMAPSTVLGYEERRDELEWFVDRRYIETFGLKPCTMLDLGCGDGFWADIFARRGFSVVGVDRDPDALAHARARPAPRPPIEASSFAGGAETLEGPENPVTYLVLDFDDPIQFDALAHGVKTKGAPRVVFARTLPHFYQPDLDQARDLLERVIAELLDPGNDTLLLLSIYTDESGENDETGATHHRMHDLLHLPLHAGGRIHTVDRAHGYVQIGVTRP